MAHRRQIEVDILLLLTHSGSVFHFRWHLLMMEANIYLWRASCEHRYHVDMPFRHLVDIRGGFDHPFDALDQWRACVVLDYAYFGCIELSVALKRWARTCKAIDSYMLVMITMMECVDTKSD